MKASVLFVCVHNAGRSQMAAGWLNELAGDRIEIRSAGTEPKEQINPIAIQAMAEVGIDIANNQPKVLTDEAVLASDYVLERVLKARSDLDLGDAVVYHRDY